MPAFSTSALLGTALGGATGGTLGGAVGGLFGRKKKAQGQTPLAPGESSAMASLPGAVAPAPDAAGAGPLDGVKKPKRKFLKSVLPGAAGGGASMYASSPGVVA
jgi:hypothetical protein